MAAPPQQYHHTLPPPPQHQQHPRPYHRPQLHNYDPQYQDSASMAKPRSLSFRSERSHHSGGSRLDTYEMHEKEAKRLHTKADPSLAINEAEPSTVAAMTHSSHTPLRSMQHKDHWGNPIADPDRSNPTRNRWERPLDTIRSFEAAIDGGYNRKSGSRADTDASATWNQRGSFHAQSQPRFPQDAYYAGRSISSRADSQLSPSTPGTGNYYSHYDAQAAYPGSNGTSYGRSMHQDRSSKMHGDSQYHNYTREPNVYPMPHKDRSYETVTSAAHSRNSDPAGYQTDPTSSDNSSIDRTSPAKRREPVNDYGIGFSQTHAYHAPNFSVGLGTTSDSLSYSSGTESSRYGAGPSVPQYQPSASKLNDTPRRPDYSEKRKSWFSRRFSKNP